MEMIDVSVHGGHIMSFGDAPCQHGSLTLGALITDY
jgi:hypothetical protein